MQNLIDPLLEIKEYKFIIESIKKDIFPLTVTGPSESQKVHLAFALCMHTGKKGVFVTHNEMQAKHIYEDLLFFLNKDVLYLPPKEILLYDVEAVSHEPLYERIKVLDRLVEGNFKFLVLSSEAMVNLVIDKDIFKKSTFILENNDNVDPVNLSKSLIMAGYNRDDMVEGKGQFAIRGGIIDIFTPDREKPVRIELFDNTIESIKEFDTTSQRSLNLLEKIRILPANEIIYDEKEAQSAAVEIRAALDSNTKIDRDRIQNDIDMITDFKNFPGLDRYYSYIFKKQLTIYEYIEESALFFLDEPERINQRMENIIKEHFEICTGLIEKGRILPETQNIISDFDSIYHTLQKRKIINFNTLSVKSETNRDSNMVSILSRLINPFYGQVNILAEDIKEWKQKNKRIIILAGTESRGKRLAETLRLKGIEAYYFGKYEKPIEKKQIIITMGNLSKGFEYVETGFIILSEGEMPGKIKRIAKSIKKSNRNKIDLFSDLKSGDYIVHQIHGIGIFEGIKQLVLDGIKRDYLKVNYQGGDSLYIPTNQLELIQKYIGSEEKKPRINKLGSNEWSKTKKKVKESLRKLAGQLIELYAKRQAVKGFAFSKDTVWQKEFEEQFPYEETEDQLKCTIEIKKDMESERVMDRLLCGDVGYGKTEVALRAIFKAVMDGRQVAYLVPTTVLAQQHYMTFKERFKGFPVNVDVISRFRSHSEQKKIIQNTESGKIDVIIGTHRLLQKDVHFKNLGLLVIDEEQRFGVAHKEKIKTKYPDIDVVTLTATPIPRTLHMSLSGIRDISILEDPPEDRYPVQTYVMEYDDDVIRNAIYRELARKGQVFYLYNRVRSIDLKTQHLAELIPDAKIASAHGKMEEKYLENVMVEFIERGYDILVCTTIIESGLDMQNVNTIIIEDSDKMGLSQLYQLRGRVGRSNRLAYAYITYRKDKIISEAAEKRLQAIREFTEFGSGFKIAMRDLEIRGAGNLLGAQQHGHMQSVGYDMYCRLLDEAVKELKGEPVAELETEVSIDLNINAYIDDRYIANESEKLDMYKEISFIKNKKDEDDIKDELSDRYGNIPEPVKLLISIALIKAMAKKAGISSITEKKGSIIFKFISPDRVDAEKVGNAIGNFGRKLFFSAGNIPYLSYKITEKDKEILTENIKSLLQHIKNFEG
jgi:transcription-repair coupling factor (superfamily II helicase)